VRVYVCVLLFVCLPGRVLITRCRSGNLSVVSSSASLPWSSQLGRAWRLVAMAASGSDVSPLLRPSVRLCVSLSASRCCCVRLAVCVFSWWPLLILLTTTGSTAPAATATGTPPPPGRPLPCRERRIVTQFCCPVSPTVTGTPAPLCCVGHWRNFRSPRLPTLPISYGSLPILNPISQQYDSLK